MITITQFAKHGGPLTKRIALAPDGSVTSDGSACVMSRGIARRLRFDNLASFSALIGALNSHEAIGLGALRADLPDHAEVVSRHKLKQMNGVGAAPHFSCRTAEYIAYEARQPALALLDSDSKGMLPSVGTRIRQVGGFWRALLTVIPELSATARVSRRSTSSGLFNQETGVKLPGSDGMHVFLLVQDGADVERFLKALHARCWLAGFGWLMVGAGGQMLERSIVDRMVGAPERLVFEGAPVLVPPLAQDTASRQPMITPGTPLDTLAACPPLTIAEQARLREMLGKEAHRLAPAIARAREAFIARQSQHLAERTGMSLTAAAHIIGRQCAGILLPHLVLPFDDEELHGSTVADVLADPGKYEGATLADPLEGPEYGRCKAMITRAADGTPWVHSFAHGRTIYHLRHDAGSIAAALAKATPEEIAELFACLAVNADLDTDELEKLRDFVARRAGVGKRAIERKLKGRRQEHARQERAENQNRRAAERQDHRPQLPAPAPDAPWLPQMEVLNEVLGASTGAEPPARDIDGVMVQVRVRRLPNMHALTPDGANDEEPEQTRLPAPQQPLLSRLTEAQLGEMIERHIEYVAEDGHPVHLAVPFVHHFHTRTDDALPLMAAIATLPLILGNGTILAKPGLDRQRGIVFRVAPELLAILPMKAECTPEAVGEAMRFLTDDWLCDVAADYAGKCILVTAALSVIERSLLPDRPVYFVTAGRRGGGKTTALVMLMMAVTGIRPAAAAWSTNEEERRKALLAYLLEAIPSIIWDNISRGSQIACPHIEKACTTEFYSDRLLGVSEMVAAAASVIQFFTGNNIAPRGDLASRALQVRLEVDRHDPENRNFRHADPVGWTEANRARILRALYTILLGNPVLRPGSNVTPPTRFKTWWRLVGSAVEYAAEQHVEQHKQRAEQHAGPQSNARATNGYYDGCSDEDSDIADDAGTDSKGADGEGTVPKAISFKDLFLGQEEEEEDSADLGDALNILDAQWPREVKFRAADVAVMVNDQSDFRPTGSDILRDFLFPKLAAGHTVTAKSVGKQLKRHVDEPVKHGDRTLVLKSAPNQDGEQHGALRYYVKVREDPKTHSA